jgi:hypothetical protein
VKQGGTDGRAGVTGRGGRMIGLSPEEMVARTAVTRLLLATVLACRLLSRRIGWH